jgi:hypothetical protein
MVADPRPSDHSAGSAAHNRTDRSCYDRASGDANRGTGCRSLGA